MELEGNGPGAEYVNVEVRIQYSVFHIVLHNKIVKNYLVVPHRGRGDEKQHNHIIVFTQAGAKQYAKQIQVGMNDVRSPP